MAHGGFRLVATVGAIIMAGALPSAAQAADHTIDFTADTPGTQLSTQYQSQDVIFGVGVTGAADQPQPLLVQANPNPPPSHVAEQVCGNEVCEMHQWIEFNPAPVDHVAVQVETTVVASAMISLTAYDGSGNPISGASVTATAQSTGLTSLSVTAPSAEINFAEIVANEPAAGEGFAFTNLTYGPYATSASPYFTFVRNFGPNGTSTFAGSSGGADFILRRFAGSTGPIDLTYSGAPQGVTLSFTPNPDSGGDQSTVAVTVAAAANAPPVTQVPVTITGTESGQPTENIVLPVTVLTSATYQLRIQGMEVTQGVQRFSLPPRDLLQPTAPVPYSGVQLVTTMPTVVRVFADAPNAPGGGVAGVEVALSGTDSLGKPLPGSPVAASTGGSLADSGSATVPPSERTNDNTSLDVPLPMSWMGAAATGPISLTATLLPPAPFGSPVVNVVCTDPACVALRTMTLSGVTAVNPGVTDIVPLQLTVNGSGPDPYGALWWASRLLPADITPDVSAGSDDITWIMQGCPSGLLGHRCSDRPSKNDWAMSAVEDFQSNYDNGSSPPMAGVTDQSLGVEDTSADDTSRLLGMTPEPVAVVNTTQPVTDVAHEIGHMFGLSHAGFECGGGDDSDNDDVGRLGSVWGPDGQGYIQGIGFDIAAGGPFYQVIAGPGGPQKTGCASNGGAECGGNSPAQFFDFMSYCEASDPNSDGTLGSTNTWVSPRNWDYIATFASCELGGGDPYGCHVTAEVAKYHELIAPARDAGAAPVAEASAAGKTRVYGYADRAGTSIAIIDPTPTRAVLVGQTSPYTLALKGRNGRTLSQAGMLMTVTHVDGPGGGPVLLLDGALPMRPAATEMAILNAGKVVAVVQRPRHTPRVSRFALGIRGLLSGTTPLVVHWRARDPDRVVLTASLDFSSDGGQVWRTVWSGPNIGRFAVPRSYLSGTRAARLRLRVSDGFDQVTIVSRRFAIAPAPPLVMIISPTSASALRPGATMLLTGAATDDARQSLTGSALTWYAGKTELGTGQQLLAKLPVGVARITLVARDPQGRTAEVSLPAVKPAKPKRLKKHKHRHTP